MQVTTSVAFMQVFEVELSVTGMLVSLSVAIMQVTVSVAISSYKVLQHICS